MARHQHERKTLQKSFRSSTARQFFEKTIKIHVNLKKLLFLKYVATHPPDRRARVFGLQQPQVVIYTDASMDFIKDDFAGAVLFDHSLPSTRAESSYSSAGSRAPLLKRMTQMMPAELLAVTGVLLGMNGMAADCDVTTTLTTIPPLPRWSVRRGSSAPRWRSSQDHPHHFVLNARVGYEHVPSGRNVPTVSLARPRGPRSDGEVENR